MTFAEWVQIFQAITGKKTSGSKQAEGMFNARAAELTDEELVLAIMGANADEYLREHGYVRPETILRPSNIGRYIEMGRKEEVSSTPAQANKAYVTTTQLAGLSGPERQRVALAGWRATKERNDRTEDASETEPDAEPGETRRSATQGE